MAEPRHRKSLVGASEFGFFTTCTLDRINSFARQRIRDEVCVQLSDNCIYYGADLRAFVVMSNHLHFVAQMPAAMDGSQLMQKIKERSAKAVIPLLSDVECDELLVAPRSRIRRLWDWSFHSSPLTSLSVFNQKMDYIHTNPVRAGVCGTPAEYTWSSARFYEGSQLSSEANIAKVALEFYRHRVSQHHGC
jgi:REP element-mobilizing transposase RayT